jgi:hypothetical protein
MIPREILKKIRQIELRTNRIVTETLAGQYHSVFKGQGMNFDEVREYQPGDDVRAIDWNVTARMNHPFIKKFVEERELTLMLVVDVSGSGLFGSRDQSKRELAAEIASVLAFSAIRNNDKVGLILFSDEVEKFIPPRKGRSHVLRVIREVLFFEPKQRGTDSPRWVMGRVLPPRPLPWSFPISTPTQAASAPPITPENSRWGAVARGPGPLPRETHTALRQTNRRHDVVGAADRFSDYRTGPVDSGRCETGEVIELNTGSATSRDAFSAASNSSKRNLPALGRGHDSASHGRPRRALGRF